MNPLKLPQTKGRITQLHYHAFKSKLSTKTNLLLTRFNGYILPNRKDTWHPPQESIAITIAA
jgi:hypothetical protein